MRKSVPQFNAGKRGLFGDVIGGEEERFINWRLDHYLTSHARWTLDELKI